MLLAGAAVVAPNTGKPPVVKASLAPAAVSRSATQSATHEPKPLVTTEATFRLPPRPKYDEIINEAARRYDLPPGLIRAVIMAESAFDPLAVSSAGAQGLMQLMPALARELGVDDVFDPRQNIMAGSKYLKSLLGEQKGNLALALASYNAGPGNVQRYRGIPPFKETRQYVKKIMNMVADDAADAPEE